MDERGVEQVFSRNHRSRVARRAGAPPAGLRVAHPRVMSNRAPQATAELLGLRRGDQR
jgi:hypothetical protein